MIVPLSILILSCGWLEKKTDFLKSVGIAPIVRVPASPVWSPEFKSHFGQKKSAF